MKSQKEKIFLMLKKQGIFLVFFMVLLSLSMVGCVKANLSIEVKGDGASVLNVAIGLNPQAKALFSTQDLDPLKNFTSGASVNDAKTTRWTDGDYEWANIERNFSNIEQMTKVISDSTLFNFFKITRTPGLIRDEYILEAELNPLSKSGDSQAGMSVDPTAFIQAEFSAKLPGQIEETNGIRDEKDSNRMTWVVLGNQPVSVKARSVAWNLYFIILSVGGFVLLVFAALVIFIYLPFKKADGKIPVSSDAAIEMKMDPKADCLEVLDVENLLGQVNSKALQQRGELRKRIGYFALVWNDQKGNQKIIEVKDLGQGQISINDQPYPADIQKTKEGILKSLSDQVGKTG